ncbi:MAG: alpha/beta hydrolase-fold protein [Nocardioides sp.]
MTPESSSPRICRLATDVSQGVPDAVERFWEELATGGTPLVEPTSDHPKERRVTFAWRYAEGTEAVHLVSALTPSPVPLTRLEGTDLGGVTYRARADLRLPYTFLVDLPGHLLHETDWSTWHPYRTTDPLNRRTFTTPSRESTHQPTVESVVELDRAPAQPWVQPRSGGPRGRFEELQVESPTIGTKRAWLWHPPVARPPTGLVVLLDGWTWATAMGMNTILDNLVADQAIPALAVVLVEEGLAEERLREYGLNADFVRFLSEDVVPSARRRSGAPDDADRTIAAGQSLGGLTAAYAALLRSDVFGNVLSQSGSFWWPHGTPHDVGAEQLTRDYARTPRLPVRFHLEVGLHEGGFMLSANRHLRDVLVAREYDVDHVELNGGHSWLTWRGSFADALVSLTGRWPRR